MKRLARNHWVLWMLIGTLLSAQSPWTHAARMRMTELQATVAATPAVAEEAPCHGHTAAPAPTADSTAHHSTDAAGCCGDGSCDGHCMHLTWASSSPPMQVDPAAPWFVSPLLVAGQLQQRLPEFFRPPI